MAFTGLFTSLLFYAQSDVKKTDNNGITIDTENKTNTIISTNNKTINGTNTYDGLGAGTIGSFNSNFGAYAGQSATVNTSQNTFIGGYAGNKNTSDQATYVGFNAGQKATSGFNSAYFGVNAGYNQTSGTNNSYMGSWSGFSNVTGNNNTFLGQSAGFNALGSGNVMLGYSAGYSETGSNRLYIHNSGSTTPLIFGDFGLSQLRFNGKVGVGTGNYPTTIGGVNIAAYTLFVKGGMLADEVRVRTGWADYVFAEDYNLKSIKEVESFIKENKHLPNVPSEKQVAEEGISVGEIAKIQMEKIEELTLYIINLHKKIEALEQKVLNKGISKNSFFYLSNNFLVFFKINIQFLFYAIFLNYF